MNGIHLFAWCFFAVISLAFFVLSITTSDATQRRPCFLALASMVGTGILGTTRLGGLDRGPLYGAWVIFSWLLVTRGRPVRLLEAAAVVKDRHVYQTGSQTDAQTLADARRMRRRGLVIILLGLLAISILLPEYLQSQAPS